MNRALRLLFVPALMLGFAASAGAQEDKKTQNPNDAQFGPQNVAPESSGEGDPLYGYLAGAFLAGITLFAICKSSRRS